MAAAAKGKVPVYFKGMSMEVVGVEDAARALILAAEMFEPNPSTLGDGKVHRENNRRRSVDRHGGGDTIEGDTVKQAFHIVQRRHRYTAVTNFAICTRIVRIDSHECRHIECDAETGLAVREQIFEAAVRIIG